MTKKIKNHEIARHTKGRKFIVVSENGLTRIQLASRRKDGSDFETLTIEPDKIEPVHTDIGPHVENVSEAKQLRCALALVVALCP